MRLLEIETQGFRGLPELSLKPAGKSFVIWGNNGEGKSGVIDAIDFVLTGRISRLMGEGTAGITLAKHGPHIDRKPEDALVSATLRISGFPGALKIRRCIANPGILECPPEAVEALRQVQDMARQGQLALTRRDILRFVTAEAGKRADQIKALLGLSDIDHVRQAFVQVKTQTTHDARTAKRSVQQARTEVGPLLKGGKFSEAKVIETVNEHRTVLGGSTLSFITAGVLKQGLTSRALTPKATLSLNTLQEAIANLQNVMQTANPATIADLDGRLRELIEEVRRNPELHAAANHLDLIRLGLRQVDEDTVSCPLCGADWPPGQLRSHLEEEEKRISAMTELHRQAADVAQSFSQTVQPVRANLSHLAKLVAESEVKESVLEELAVLSKWQVDLDRLLVALERSTDRFLETAPDPSATIRLFLPADLSEILLRLESALPKAAPQPLPEQAAWDALTRLETALSILERRVADERSAATMLQRAEALLKEFEEARDTALQQLYDRIAKRFIELYRVLHPHEASTFDAQLKPDGAALKFEVDFLGRGAHPPHALHSEGHQDSMGLCLFLALNEDLSKNQVDLIALDDVMMSVDASHRKELCKLLRNAFPGKQFLITTHDRAWAKQLQHEGVVEQANLIEFTGWNVETGPRFNAQVDLWKRIADDLAREDVPEAAFKLRRGSEEFFESVCDALSASVVYNSRGEWDLGDWLPAATNRYKELLRKARRAAVSWGNTSAVSKLDVLESIRKQILTRTYVEQWAINPSVHYNNWQSFTKEDFAPVVDAFCDLHASFSCSNCPGLLQAVPSGEKPDVVKCNCGAVLWNLKVKS